MITGLQGVSGKGRDKDSEVRASADVPRAPSVAVMRSALIKPKTPVRVL
jgi:hypothetical protein